MTRNCSSAWNECLSIIKESINPNSFTTWFKPINPVDYDGKDLTVEVPSQFFYEWLESHYNNRLPDSICEIPDSCFLSPDRYSFRTMRVEQVAFRSTFSETLPINQSPAPLRP